MGFAKIASYLRFDRLHDGDFRHPTSGALPLRRLPILIALATLMALVLPSLGEAACVRAAVSWSAGNGPKTAVVSRTDLTLKTLQFDDDQTDLPRHALTCQHSHCRGAQTGVVGSSVHFTLLISNRPVFVSSKENMIISSPPFGLERPPRLA